MSQAGDPPRPPPTDVGDEPPRQDIDFGEDRPRAPASDTTEDPRSDQEKQQDAELANRLSLLIEGANERVVPLVKQMREVRLFRHLDQAK